MQHLQCPGKSERLISAEYGTVQNKMISENDLKLMASSSGAISSRLIDVYFDLPYPL